MVNNCSLLLKHRKQKRQGSYDHNALPQLSTSSSLTSHLECSAIIANTIETFLSIIPYQDENDAARMASGTTLYGFVPFGDLERCRRLQTDQGTFINAARPDFGGSFGGYKQSGNGREFFRYASSGTPGSWQCPQGCLVENNVHSGSGMSPFWRNLTVQHPRAAA
jgi:hypothetical protein